MADSAWQPGTPLTGPAGRGAEQHRWAQAFPPGRARAPQLSRASMASGVTSVGSPFLAGSFLPASSAWNSCLRVDSTVSCSSGVFPAFSPSGRRVLRERCRPPPAARAACGAVSWQAQLPGARPEAPGGPGSSAHGRNGGSELGWCPGHLVSGVEWDLRCQGGLHFLGKDLPVVESAWGRAPWLCAGRCPLGLILITGRSVPPRPLGMPGRTSPRSPWAPFPLPRVC